MTEMGQGSKAVATATPNVGFTLSSGQGGRGKSQAREIGGGGGAGVMEKSGGREGERGQGFRSPHKGGRTEGK